MSSEIQSRVSSLEEELLVKDRTLKSIQSEMVQMKKELAAKEFSLQKVSNELSVAHIRLTQDSERVNTHTTANASGDFIATGENVSHISANVPYFPEALLFLTRKRC